MAKPTQAPNNPFACATNAVKMHTVGPCCCVLLAVFEYAVSGGGASIQLTPLTGNDSADLKYYRFTIFDKFGNSVGGELDLANPTVAIDVDTSALDANGDWMIKFAACKQEGTEECSIGYDLKIYNPASNPSGNSTPAAYENVTFLLTLNQTDDLNFTEFPAEGLEIKDGDIVDFNAFLSGATQLTGTQYNFDLLLKKCWYSPTANIPTGVDQAVFDSFTAVTYPVAISNAGVVVAEELLLTISSGQFSEVLTVTLNNEGVQPSISFTGKTDFV